MTNSCRIMLTGDKQLSNYVNFQKRREERMSDFTLYKVSQDFENLIDLIDRDVLEDQEVVDL